MKEKNHEEIRQILSIVNYKIVLYSLLIQNTKGVAQTYRKITGCIHAMSAILSDDAVPSPLFFHSSALSSPSGRRSCRRNSPTFSVRLWNYSDSCRFM